MKEDYELKRNIKAFVDVVFYGFMVIVVFVGGGFILFEIFERYLGG